MKSQKLAFAISFCCFCYSALAQVKSRQLSRFYYQYTYLELTSQNSALELDYTKFQSGRDAFSANNDMDSVRSNVLFAQIHSGPTARILYDLTNDDNKKWSQLVGLSYWGVGTFSGASSAFKESSQTVDTVTVQGTGAKIPVTLTLSETEKEEFKVRYNLVGMNYMLSYNHNKRWSFNTMFGLGYYITQRAEALVVRTFNQNYEPSIYHVVGVSDSSQFGQRMGINLGLASLCFAPTILLNAQEKKKNGEDFLFRFYLGFQFDIYATMGRVNKSDYFSLGGGYRMLITIRPWKYSEYRNVLKTGLHLRGKT